MSPTPPPITLTPLLTSLKNYYLTSLPLLTLTLLALSLPLLLLPAQQISDCDEVYNYYEPLHFTLWKEERAMQTWEYAGPYYLRTFTFLAPMKICLGLFVKLGVDKVNVFVISKVIILILHCGACAKLITSLTSVDKTQNKLLPLLTLLFISPICTPGLSPPYTTSYLPSTISLSLQILSMAYHINLQFEKAIGAGLVAVLFTGWPFVSVCFIPLGLHSCHYMLLNNTKNTPNYKNLIKLLTFVITTTAALLITSLLTDYTYYKTLTSPTMNILKYNAFAGGDELYGVEGWTYYVFNVLINFNIIGVLAFVTPLFVGVMHYLTPSNSGKHLITIIITPLYIWTSILMSRPHKEERFLTPVYGLIAVCAAVSVCYGRDFVANLCGSDDRYKKNDDYKAGVIVKPRLLKLYDLCVVVLIALCVGLNVMRQTAQIAHYSAPVKVYTQLFHHITSSNIDSVMEKDEGGEEKEKVIVCTSSEWYRYPSSFFLPPSAELHYLPSPSFKGQLPGAFDSDVGFAGVNRHHAFNDLNLGEADRYTKSVDECDYIVDLIDPEESSGTPINFKVLFEERFMIADKTGRFDRLVYVPFGGYDGAVYGVFTVFEEA